MGFGPLMAASKKKSRTPARFDTGPPSTRKRMKSGKDGQGEGENCQGKRLST